MNNLEVIHGTSDKDGKPAEVVTMDNASAESLITDATAWRYYSAMKDLHAVPTNEEWLSSTILELQEQQERLDERERKLDALEARLQGQKELLVELLSRTLRTTTAQADGCGH